MPALFKSKKVSTKWEGPILRARGADFEVEGEAGLMQMCKHEQTRGSGGMLSLEISNLSLLKWR